MFRASALVQLARETGVVAPDRLIVHLAEWQQSNPAQPFRNWCYEHHAIPRSAVNVLEDAFDESVFHCLDCHAVLVGRALLGTNKLACSACGRSNLRRERVTAPAASGEMVVPRQQRAASEPTPPDGTPRSSADRKTKMISLNEAWKRLEEMGVRGVREQQPEPHALPDDSTGSVDAVPLTSRNARKGAFSALTGEPASAAAPPAPADADAGDAADSASPEEMAGTGGGDILITGGWRIVVQAGESIIGRVWKAWHTLLDHYAAVRVLEGSDDSRVHAVFRKAVLLWARLDNPHIVRVRELGAYMGRPCVLTEWQEGGSARDHLARYGQLPVETVVQIGIECARALHAAHEVGVAHGALRPSGVLWARDGRVKLTGFGLAMVRARMIASGHTDTIAPLYPVPGQDPTTERFTPADDIYQLGSMLFHLLAGKTPDEARAGHHDRFPPVRGYNPDATGSLERLLSACGRPEPADRPESMNVIIERLREVAMGLRTANTKALGDPAATVDVIRVPGKLDVQTWLEVEALVDSCLRDGSRRFVLDLSGCNKAEPSGVSAMGMLNDGLAGHGTLVLAGITPQLQIVLEMMGVTQNFRAAPNVSEAVQRLGRGEVRRHHTPGQSIG